MFVVTVRFTIKPGFEGRFGERVRAQARASLDVEAGCRQFDVRPAAGNRRHLFLYEVYRTEADFRAHLQTPHFLAFDAGTRDWIDGKVVECWERAEDVQPRSSKEKRCREESV